ncbi:MAG: hypothetical protein AAF587_33735 [Bacteroidota bacterium]
MSIRLFLLLVCIPACQFLLPVYSQTPTTVVDAYYIDVDDNTNDYSTIGTGNGVYSAGTSYSLSFSSSSVSDNNLILDFIKVGTDTLYPSNKIAIPKVRRQDNSIWTGTREVLFFERATFSSPNVDLSPGFVSTIESALNSTTVNRGVDNLFQNTSSSDGNNVERLDYIYANGLKASNVSKEGFLLLEKGGNDKLRIAAILSLDGSGDPASFGSLVAVPSGATYWGNSSLSMQTTSFRDTNATAVSTLLPYENASSETIHGSFVSLTNLGITNGSTIYGYALFAYDTPSGTASSNLLDWTNSAYFPTTTDPSNGGSDMIAGGLFMTAQDTDFDGIADATDQDDDNDGIKDIEECVLKSRIDPDDLGYGKSDTSPFNITNRDISSLFGLATGSVILNATNVTVNPNNAKQWNHAHGDPIPSFSFSGSMYAILTNINHGTVLAGSGDRDGIIATDGNTYNQIKTLESGYTNGTSGNTYYVEADGTEDGKNNSGLRWQSTSSPISSFQVFSTNGATINAFFFELWIPCDTDSDGNPDFVDTDSDDDGIPDIIEAGGVDADGDGHVDVTTDTDADGLVDLYDTDNGGTSIPNPDSDGDGIKDFRDLDSDADGIPDLIEAGGIDTDGDGRVDVDVSVEVNDMDGDGFADIYDPDDDGFENIDVGESSAPLAKSTDSGTDGQYDSITDGSGMSLNSDSDSSPDFLDLDADQDGIPDLVEAKGIDNNGDGRVDVSTDADGDGLADLYDTDASDGPSGSGTNGSALVQTDGTDSDGDYKADDTAIIFEHGDGTKLDTDGDGVPDFLDLDADNDGAPDIVEAGGIDSNGDGRTDSSTDADADGLVDVFDSNASDGPGGSGSNGSALVKTAGSDTDSDGLADDDAITWTHGNGMSIDTDGDRCPDQLDVDADNDGIPDLIDLGGIDSQADGRIDVTTDADGDGLADIYDSNASDGPRGSGTNGSALIQTNGTDTNSDGLADGDATIGYVNGASSGLPDTDADKIPNHIDLDADGDGLLDVTEAGGLDAEAEISISIGADGNGIADGDTDADKDGYIDTYDPNTSDGPGGTGTNGTALMTVAADGVDSDSRGEYTHGAGIGDSDGDDVPDFLDVDADNDGIFDIYEAQLTAGYVRPDGSDDDKDGIDNAFDDDDLNFGGATDAGLTAINTGGSGLPDYLDTDSDGDEVPDIQEAWDALDDGDSRPDGLTWSECLIDTDGDGLVDCFDSDDANITVSTITTNPPADDGTGGSTSSVGIDITASNEVDDIFPNNALGSSVAEPDWRDNGNVDCSSGLTIYALTDAGTAYEWDSTSLKHQNTTTTGIIRATALCKGVAGWYRFYNPLEPDKFLFAIKNGTNTVDLTEVIDYIEIEIQAAPVIKKGVSSGLAVMARSWKVVTKGNLNGTVRIRFYFTPSEYNTFLSQANVMKSNYIGGALEYEWFKTDDGLDFKNVPSSTSGFSGKNFARMNSNVSGKREGQTDGDSRGNSKKHVQFNGITGFSGGTYSAEIAGSLPVEWLSFDAEQKGDAAILNWSTASETNSDFYSIERSINGRNFNPLAQVAAAGTTTEISEYDYTDEFVIRLGSPKLFYRLRQTDLDGTYDYSNVVELNVSDKQADIWMQAMPNPVKDRLTVKYSIPGQDRAFLEARSGAGQLIYSSPIQDPVGQKEIYVNQWPGGLYFLRIKSRQKQAVFKVVVER